MEHSKAVALARSLKKSVPHAAQAFEEVIAEVALATDLIEIILYDSKKNKYKTISRSIIVDGSQVLKADVVDFMDMGKINSKKYDCIILSGGSSLSVSGHEKEYQNEINIYFKLLLLLLVFNKSVNNYI